MDKNVKHPCEFLPLTVTSEIRHEAGAAEQNRFLTNRQQQMIFNHQWLNLYVPKTYGGLQLKLPEILRIEEGLAWADGSTSWVVTLCSGAAWFVGFLKPELAHKIFSEKDVWFAGSGAVTGTAAQRNGNYLINGYWKYATGSLMATVFTINCQVIENGSPLRDETGTPMVRSFILKKDEVHIHRTWNAMGMIATGSHAFEIRDLVVPSNRAFNIHPRHAVEKDTIFQYPFLQLAETTLAVNISGMAVRFLDLCQQIISDRNTGEVNEEFRVGNRYINELRNGFYSSADESWSVLTNDNAIPDYLLGRVSNASRALVFGARKVVNDLYPLCGLQAADAGSEINRVWRNFHTASQHNLFGSRTSG